MILWLAVESIVPRWITAETIIDMSIDTSLAALAWTVPLRRAERPTEENLNQDKISL